MKVSETHDYVVYYHHPNELEIIFKNFNIQKTLINV